MRLVECPSCQRHVRSTDDECPFCGHGPIMRPAPRFSFASVLVAAPLLLATASCDSGKGTAESDAPTTKGEPANNEGGNAEGGNAEGGQAIDPKPDDRPPAEKYGAPPPPPDDIEPVAEGGEEIDKPNPDDERIEAPRYGAPPPPPDAIEPPKDERPAARKYGAPPAPADSPLE